MSVEQSEVELRERARMLVRGQLTEPAAQLAALEEAVRAAMPHTDAAILARAWLAAAHRQLVADAAQWERPTDHERLTRALDECRQHDVVVVLGVTDQDELRAEVARQLADRDATSPVRGVVWASEADVFHAVDQGVLELRPLRPDATPALHDDHLVTAVSACLQRHGLRSRFHQGHLQVAVRWQAVPNA